MKKINNQNIARQGRSIDGIHTICINCQFLSLHFQNTNCQLEKIYTILIWVSFELEIEYLVVGVHFGTLCSSETQRQWSFFCRYCNQERMKTFSMIFTLGNTSRERDRGVYKRDGNKIFGKINFIPQTSI